MEKKTKKTTGLILGKFLPLHKGHCYLIERARQQVDHLLVIVGSLKNEPIPGELRFRWVKEMFSGLGVEVVHLTDENPQEPHEHPDFWNIWVQSIRKFCPQGPDLLFSSEEYGYELARRLGAEHIPVDIGRTTFPISGTMVRQAPFRYWDFIPDQVRPYFVKKVVIYGPESTGKTTLAAQLAAYYHTVWVPEYARAMLDEKGLENGLSNTIEYSDFPKIARGQVTTEDDSHRRANKLLFCDSDLLTTVIYSRYFFKACHQCIVEEANRRALTYDLYLLCAVDVPWAADPQRETGDSREYYFEVFKKELDDRGLPYKILSGLGEERLRNAVRIIDELIKPYG